MRPTHRNTRSGIAILEFALVTPLFLLICVAAIDFGRIFQTAMTITGANRVGLQYAGSNSGAAADTLGIANAVKTAAGSPSGLSVVSSQFCTCSLGGPQIDCANACSGKIPYVQVTTKVNFKTISAWPWVPNSLDVTSAGIIRVQ